MNTREEQIEIVKRLLKTGVSDDARMVLERQFPEVVESEDERIRKELIAALKQLDRDKTPVDTYNYSGWISWLEKPKEQKPIAESKRLANEVIEYLRKFGYSPVLKDDSKKEHFHIDIPRHEDDFWQSEEYKHCRSVLGEYYMEGDYGGDTYTLYVWREKKEKKPAEWSEEDEWMINSIISTLEANKVFTYKYDKLGQIDHDKKISWLKSLRSRPHWKPSEEQIEALECAERWYSDNMGCNHVLYQLLCDLKKIVAYETNYSGYVSKQKNLLN